MNVSELARKLKVNSKDLLEILPVVGFSVGKRAIKIDDRQAQQIVEQWPNLMAKYKELTGVEEKEAVVVDVPKEIKKVAIPSSVRVKDFAEKLGVPLPKVMTELMKNGVLSSMNERIDFDTAAIVGSELGFEILPGSDAAEAEKNTVDKLESLLSSGGQKGSTPRPPVVVVMGHVDHGKTKLLDAIRSTNVIDGESGGITQHIGAYQVMIPSKKESSSRENRGIPRSTRDDSAPGRTITFIDTPGHEAFTTMRSRGARVADVAILVVAADDSIQPQTKESIKIINSAGIPMVVAINKIDKPGANIEKVKQDLAGLNLLPEDWGGKTICVPISAKQGTGIDDLLEMVLLVADTEKDTIQANPNSLAVGTIVESHIDQGEGPVATVLIQNGTLRRGDQAEVSDVFYGKIRAMKDFKGHDVDFAPPSMPVKILGLKAAPSVGDILTVRSDNTKSQKINKYKLTQQATDYSKAKESSNDDKKGVKTLNMVIKSDVLGSLEAIIASLTALDNPEVAVNIVSKGLGNITENDVQRALSSNAWLVGFHVKPTQPAANLAKDKKVDIKQYEIIYKLIEETSKRLEEMLEPEVIRTDLGWLKALALFKKAKDSVVVGGQVTKGKIALNAKVDVMRGTRKVATGFITQLQANKVDVNEVNHGSECGLKFEGKPVVEVGDVLEVYLEVIKQKKLK